MLTHMENDKNIDLQKRQLSHAESEKILQLKNTIVGSETWKMLKLQKRPQTLSRIPHTKVMSILSFLEICRFSRVAAYGENEEKIVTRSTSAFKFKYV